MNLLPCQWLYNQVGNNLSLCPNLLNPHSSFLIPLSSLLLAHCSLLTAHCSLLVAHCCCLLPRCRLQAIHWLSSTTEHCSLSISTLQFLCRSASAAPLNSFKTIEGNPCNGNVRLAHRASRKCMNGEYYCHYHVPVVSVVCCCCCCCCCCVLQ